MPGSQELIHIIDLPSNIRDIDSLIEYLAKLEAKIAGISGVSLGTKAAGGASEFKANSEAMSQAMEKIIALEKELQALKEKGAIKSKQKSDEDIKQQAEAQLARQKAMAAAKDEIRLNQAAEESLNKKRIQLKQLQATYDALAGAQRNAAEGKELLKNIQQLDAEVKKLEYDTGRFQRNVGNYADAFRNFGNIGKQAVDKVNDSFSGLWSKLTGMAAAFIGIQGIFEFFKSSIEVFEKSEQSIKREENALKNLGATVGDIHLLNQSLSDLTGKYTYLSKVDLRDAQQKLITYGKLSAEQIKEFLPTVVNFAANARISVGEATDVLIKGLEGSARAMKTYGINVKDAATPAERFVLIQQELAAKVEGSAKVFGDSAEGKIETYKRQLGALKKGIGEQLMPVYEQFLGGTIKIGQVLKALDFGTIVRSIAALAGVWIVYRTALLAAHVATVVNTSALIAHKAASEGVTVAKAAEAYAESMDGKAKASNTFLTYAIAAAQRVYAAATRLLTFEITLFGNAIRITPLGIFLTLVGLTITAFGAFASQTTKVAGSIAKTKAEIAATNEVVKKGNEVFAEQKTVIDELVDKVKNHNLSLKDRKKALEELIELDPKYLNGLTLENSETEKGTKLIDKYVEALHKKAIAEAAQDIMRSDALKRTQAQLDLAVENEDFAKKQATAEKARRDNTKAGNSNSYLEGQWQGIKEKHQDIVDEMNKIIADVDNRQGALDNIIKKNVTDAKFNQHSGLGGYTDKDKEAAKKELEYQIKLLELLAQERIERLKIVADSKDSPAFSRLKAEEEIFAIEKEMIIRRRNLELMEAKLTAAQRAYIIEKANDDLYKKEVEYLLKVQQISAESLKKTREDQLLTEKDLQEMREKNFKVQDDLAKKLNERRKNYIDEARDYELRSLEERRGKGEITPKEYEKQKSRINNQADIYDLKADEDLVKAEIALAELRGESTVALEAKYANLEKEIEIKKNADKIKSAEEAKKRKDALKEREIEFGREAENTLAAFVDARFQNEINAIQKQIDGANKLKETQLRNIEESNLSATQKAAAERELEAKSAQQTAELQAKQRAAKIKEARFDRDKAIFDIAANTAIAVTKALPDIPLAIAVGAIGAIQALSVIMKPIPSYEVGTDCHPGGLMKVHPGELRIDPDGKMTMTPDAPETLTYGDPGTRIIPAEEVNQMLMATIFSNPGPMHVDQAGELKQEIRELRQDLRKHSQDQINAMRKQAPPVINIRNDADFNAHIETSCKR